MDLKEQPQYQSFHLEGVKHIAPKEAYSLILKDQAIILDVREKDEFEVEHVDTPNVLLHPMPQSYIRCRKLWNACNISPPIA